MTRRGRALGIVLVLAMAGIPAVSATTAGAKKKKKKPGVVTRSASATVTGPGAIAAATAVCPKKTKALSGGFLLSPPGPGTGNIGLVYESQKVGQNSWRVSAQNLDTGAPESLTLTAFVYCRKGAPSTSTVTVSNAKPATLQLGPAATPTCAGKLNAMSGGLLSGPPVVGSGAKEITIESARTTAKTWQSNWLSGTIATDTLAGYAYCAKGKLPSAVTTTSAPNTTSSTPTTVTATCTGKTKIVGGGFAEPTIDLTPPGGYFIVLESQRTSAKVWQVTGVKISTDPATLSATAYCSK